MNQKLRKLLCVSFAGIVLVSCSKNAKEFSPDTSKLSAMSAAAPINWAAMTVEQKRQVLESDLMDIAKYVVRAAEANTTSRNAIYAELEKNVDSDNNALIDLFSKNINALNADSNFKNSLAVFSNLEGNRYFPQVYIYNYDSLKSVRKIGTSNPILAVFYTGDETQTSVKAYQLDASGNWQYNKMVDENVCANEEVWVFSLNETFTNTIDPSLVQTPAIPLDGPSTPPDIASGYCTDGDHYWPYIEYMTIRKRNESWLAGKSDIWMVTYTTWNNAGSVDPCQL